MPRRIHQPTDIPPCSVPQNENEADQHQQDPGAGFEVEGRRAAHAVSLLGQPQRQPAGADGHGGDRRNGQRRPQAITKVDTTPAQ